MGRPFVGEFDLDILVIFIEKCFVVDGECLKTKEGHTFSDICSR